ncbi:hypothetical protein [uncultured Tateyamaria sp.]|uniref:hypothetical protein n=1 Tax=uncultured Tateyamaria sp. TaxID=455651 RepID=UPI0026344562|nr:hypothetical protein [uncultured Tateyamaria sp.]
MTTYHPDQTTETKNGKDGNTLADAARKEFETRRAQAGDALDSTRRQVADTAQRTSDQGAQFVRDNPALALAGAAGIGFLLGLAIRVRD